MTAARLTRAGVPSGWLFAATAAAGALTMHKRLSALALELAVDAVARDYNGLVDELATARRQLEQAQTKLAYLESVGRDREAMS